MAEIIEQKLVLELDKDEVTAIKLALAHLITHKSTKDEYGMEIGLYWRKICSQIHSEIT